MWLTVQQLKEKLANLPEEALITVYDDDDVGEQFIDVYENDGEGSSGDLVERITVFIV